MQNVVMFFYDDVIGFVNFMLQLGSVAWFRVGKRPQRLAKGGGLFTFDGKT